MLCGFARELLLDSLFVCLFVWGIGYRLSIVIRILFHFTTWQLANERIQGLFAWQRNILKGRAKEST